MKKIKNHMLIIEKAMGVLLLIVGVLLLTGGFSKVSFFLFELKPFFGNIG
jgi:cytochrome c-type biogenesis protein